MTAQRILVIVMSVAATLVTLPAAFPTADAACDDSQCVSGSFSVATTAAGGAMKDSSCTAHSGAGTTYGVFTSGTCEFSCIAGQHFYAALGLGVATVTARCGGVGATCTVPNLSSIFSCASTAVPGANGIGTCTVSGAFWNNAVCG